MTNPEQRILDDIDALVDWQMDRGETGDDCEVRIAAVPNFSSGGVTGSGQGSATAGFVMVRYGTEWQRLDQVDGCITIPSDCDEWVLCTPGGGGSGGSTMAHIGTNGRDA